MVTNGASSLAALRAAWFTIVLMSAPVRGGDTDRGCLQRGQVIVSRDRPTPQENIEIIYVVLQICTIVQNFGHLGIDRQRQAVRILPVSPVVFIARFLMFRSEFVQNFFFKHVYMNELTMYCQSEKMKRQKILKSIVLQQKTKEIQIFLKC